MFLNPWMLFAVAGVAGPIIIHLLNRRKIIRIDWAAMRFLQDAHQQNQRRMNIEDLLLLILRCLVVALIALAMSRPALRASLASLFGQSTVTAAIVIDNSASTSLTDGTISRFDESKRLAKEIVSTMPRGSGVAVYLASDVLTPLIPEPTTDLALVTATIDQARRSDRTSDLLPAITGAIEQLQHQPAIRKELYLLTDDQALAFKHAEEIHARLQGAKDSVHTTIITNGVTETHNLAVTGLSLDITQIPAVDTPIAFDVHMSNTGASAATDVSVALSIDDKAPVAQGQLTDIPPHKSRSISLVTTIGAAGYHSVTASVPRDRMPADDRRTMAVHVVKQIQVLLVSEQPPGQAAAQNSAFYLRHALVPVSPEERGAYVIQTTSIRPEQLETAKLSNYAVVGLVDITAPTPTAANLLVKYVSAGGGLVIFAGPDTAPDSFNQRLADTLLPARLGPLRSDGTLTLQAGDYTHPIVSIWSDPAAGTLSTARFNHSYQLQPIAGTPQSPVAAILQFSDHTPAIVSRRVGRGEAILFASSADTQWNDLPVHPAFVPLMQRVIGELAQHADANLNIRVGDPFVFQAPGELTGKDATVLQPSDGTTQSREVSRVELLNGIPTLTATDTGYAGAYAINTPEPTAVFAAQQDPAESDLTPTTPETQKLLAEDASLIRYDARVNLADAVRTERIGKELWLFLGVSALLLSTAELFLSNRFSRPK